MDEAVPGRFRFTVAAALLTCTVPVWLDGGTITRLQPPLPWLAGLLLVSFLFDLRSAENRARIRWSDLRLRGPVALAFVALLAIQWWNAGRSLEWTGSGWQPSPPPHPGWPSCFRTAYGKEMLSWFLPAAFLSVVLHAIRLTRGEAFFLLGGIVANGSAASLLCCTRWIQQVKAGGQSLRNAVLGPPLTGYANHLGALMVLLTGIALALFSHAYLTSRPRRMRSALAASVALTVLAAHLSLSRAAILLTWLLITLCTITLCRFRWPDWNASQRLTRTAALVAPILLAMAMLTNTSMHQASTEFGDLFVPGRGLSASRMTQSTLLGNRALLRRACLGIFVEAPLTGTGGWGLAHLAHCHLDASEIASLGQGAANAHCDPLQFLTEFGLLGTTMLGFLMLWPGKQRVRHPRVNPPVLGMLLTTAALIAAYALIDLPFRSPPIIYTFIAVVAVWRSLAHRTHNLWDDIPRSPRRHGWRVADTVRSHPGQ